MTSMPPPLNFPLSSVRPALVGPTRFSPAPNGPSTVIVTIQNGQLMLNGKAYKIANLKIRGQQIDLTTPLTEGQLQKIQQFVENVFKATKEINLLRPDLQSVVLKATPEKQISVTTTYRQSSTSQLAESNTEVVSPLASSGQLTTISREFQRKVRPRGIYVKKEDLLESLLNAKTVARQALANPTAAAPFYGEGHELDGPMGPEQEFVTAQTKATLPKPPQDAVISHSYQIDNQQVAHQEITRSNTVDAHVRFVENTLEKLDAKLKDTRLHLSEAERQHITLDIQYYQEALANAKNHLGVNINTGNAWLNSSYFRDLIKRCNNFVEATQAYISAPINMRYQKLTIGNSDIQEVGFYRVGIMSDMRNGWVSLTDLKNMRTNATLIQAKIQEIENYIRHPGGKKKPLTGNRLESANYALNQLKIMANYPETIEVYIADRRRVIQQQMIQLIEGQVSQNGKKVQEALESGGTFDLVHVSLLNQKKSDLDKTGWMHDERVEMEDMNEIFEEFKGKKLVFDGKGPFIDGETIHLSRQLQTSTGGKTGNQVTLNTFFFNTSVQGNVDNNGTQRRINTIQLASLEKSHPQIFAKHPELAKAILMGEKTGYGIAEDLLAMLLSEPSLCVSFGCLSAKDRTGFVAERLMLRAMQPHLPNPMEKNPFEKEIFDPNGPAVRIVADNTPNFTALKVNPNATLRGHNALDKLGLLTKMGMAVLNQKKSKSTVPTPKKHTYTVLLPEDTRRKSTAVAA